MHTDDPDLARYQLSAFSRQLPVMYGILMVNAVALAATHAGTAPWPLTYLVPAVLGTVCVFRTVFWLRSAGVVPTDQQASRRLRATTPLVLLLGVCFTAWSFALYPYGDSFAKCHVAFYMSITVISCIFCLMHLRTAALLLTAIVIAPFTVFFCLSGEVVLIAISLNFVLVSAGMVLVLLRNYGDFTTMIVSRRELLARQQETQRLNDENLRLACLDSLTGLPNRRSFFAQLDAVLARSGRDARRFAVALVDLDGFKGVNDAHGHATGDQLLAEVGERLTAIADARTFVARLGGDEFGVIGEGEQSDMELAAFGRRLCAAVRGPYQVRGIVAEVTGSVGLVAFPDGGQTARQLFERADYALYHGKQHERGDAVMFSDEHEVMIREASRIEQALRHADLEREMWPAFQPIVDGTTGQAVGFEALARWSSPDLGMVPPGVFIPLAERIQIIGPITEALLAKALRAAARWPDHLRVAVNLSARDLSSPHTIEAACRVVASSGVAPHRIDMEITETAVMRDFNQASDALATLRRLGIRISLDDFGTGFSSLSHVHRLKIDKIKIDRSFVEEVLDSQTACDIVRTIVDLCRNLGLDCVVEGVETEPQRRRLLALGCRLMQGYLFSRPLPERAIADYLADSAKPLLAVS